MGFKIPLRCITNCGMDPSIITILTNNYPQIFLKKSTDGMANSVDWYQTAPLRAVWSGSTSFLRPICPNIQSKYGSKYSFPNGSKFWRLYIVCVCVLCVLLFFFWKNVTKLDMCPQMPPPYGLCPYGCFLWPHPTATALARSGFQTLVSV